MRKVVFLIHMSLDGFVAGPNGEMDWIVYNEDVEHYGHALHQSTDTAIYGRITYEMMESYWPNVLNDPTATPGALNHAHWLEASTKIVFSKTLEAVHWQKTVLIHDDVAGEMARIKQQRGKDMWLIGSPTLAQTFMRLGLIDDYRINLNPVVLGHGRPLFNPADKQPALKLIEAKALMGGVVALRYAPAQS